MQHTGKDALGDFRNIPPIIFSRTRTQVVALLALNHQIRRAEIEHHMGDATGSARLTLNTLRKMGMAAQVRVAYANRPWFLNPAHPAHDSLRAFGRAIGMRWWIPRNDLPPVPSAWLQACQMPLSPPNELFGYDVTTKCLLFIAAAGGANLAELNDMLGVEVRGQTKTVMRAVSSLERRDLVVRVPNPKWTSEKPAILNPDFFAYHELRALLNDLLLVHDDIPVLVKRMRQYRLNRWYPENRSKPHI